MKNAVIFSRGADIRQQVKKCNNYAKLAGYNVIGSIVGGSHEIKETIESINNNIEIVLVANISKVFGSVEEYELTKTEMEELNILLESAAK